MKLISFLESSNSDNSSYSEKLAPALAADASMSLPQIYQILERLQGDLLACDARLSLFVAAANSYRYETLVQPFPEQFVDQKQKLNIDGIFDALSELDRLDIVLDMLKKANYNKCQQNVLKLLYDILVRHGDYVALNTLRSYEFKDLYVHLKIEPPLVKPTQIFEVTPSLKCEHTKAYTNLREKYPVSMGFYGGKLEELYAMLTLGKLPLNDDPLLLNSDVNEALKRTSFGVGWSGSRCGTMQCYVAVVEFVVVPEQVTVDSAKRQILVKDGNCMQISYIMFFGENLPDYGQELALQSRMSVNWKDTYEWLEDNKYSISLGVYLMMLSLTSSSGRGMLHKFATTGLYMFKKGFFKI